MRATRRFFLGSAAAIVAMPRLTLGATSVKTRLYPAQTTWPSELAPKHMTKGFVTTEGVKLAYWDTGGVGTPIVLLHAFTGSGNGWAYQFPALSQAGYRVISYSRRGYYGSDRGPDGQGGNAVADLHALVTQLGLNRWHLVGTAAGGGIAVDYALTHPQNVRSLTLASSLCGIEMPEFTAISEQLITPEFKALTPVLKELGPSYRAANRDGVVRWSMLEKAALSGAPVKQTQTNTVTWSALETLTMPVLLLTGDADLYMPPSRLNMVAPHIRNAQIAIIDQAGHAAYWEQPDAFNKAVLRFAGAVK